MRDLSCFGQCDLDNPQCIKCNDKYCQVLNEIHMETNFFEEHDEKVRTAAIDECIQIVQKVKDDYNDAKFGEQIPINYGTICGIIIALNHLKDGK